MSNFYNLEERTIGYALRVIPPKPVIPNKGFVECCYKNIVFGDTTSNEDYNNDYYGVYFKKQISTDTCDLTFFIVSWKKVLTLLGEGQFFIRKDITFVGVPYTEFSNNFIVKQFTNDLADLTVRFDCIQNGYLEHLDIDFKGTNFKTSLRTLGFFGRREPDYIQENDVYRNENVVQNNMMQENEYLYQAGLLPECITEELFDFVLFGNELFLNDYNKNNHSYYFRKSAVVYKSNKGTKYYTLNRNAQINLSFEDRIKNKRKINN